MSTEPTNIESKEVSSVIGKQQLLIKMQLQHQHSRTAKEQLAVKSDLAKRLGNAANAAG